MNKSQNKKASTAMSDKQTELTTSESHSVMITVNGNGELRFQRYFFSPIDCRPKIMSDDGKSEVDYLESIGIDADFDDLVCDQSLDCDESDDGLPL